MKAIKNGLGGLLRFTGRDRQAMFWLYALAVLVLTFVVIAAITVPPVADTFTQFERFAAEHPELVTVTETSQGQSIMIEGHHPELEPDFGPIMLGMGVGIIMAVLLLAAAVARRLHDSGRSGLWGLMPVPFLVIGLAIFPKLMTSFSGSEPNFGLFGLLFVNNLAYMGTLIALILLLSMRGTPGPNRFGEAPQAPPEPD